MGDYILDAVLTSPDGSAYDCLAHFIEFSVTSSNQFGEGIVAMDNKWYLASEVNSDDGIEEK